MPSIEFHPDSREGAEPSTLGMTLIELIVCTVIIGILSATALPLSRHVIRQKKEELLKEELRNIREGIDRYHERMSQKNPGLSEEMLYPRDLDQLVQERILRRIPRDPMTGKPDWRTVSTNDPIGASNTDSLNVFDVFSTSSESTVDGTPYSSW